MADPAEPWSSAPAACARHVDRPSVGTCARCGDFLCDDCAITRPDGWSCRACSRVSPVGDASWLALGAAMLGFLSFCVPPLALGASLCAALDLGRIALRSAPPAGWKLDALGLAMAVVASLVWGLIVARTLGDAAGTLGGLEGL